MEAFKIIATIFISVALSIIVMVMSFKIAEYCEEKFDWNPVSVIYLIMAIFLIISGGILFLI